MDIVLGRPNSGTQSTGDGRSYGAADPLVDACDGPGGGFADERLGIFEGALERGQNGNIALIAEHDGRIAEQAASPGSGQGGAAETAAEFRIAKAQELNRIGRLQIRKRLECGLRTWRCLAIPGADLLANIATE